jgi:hypothetical protein
MSQRGCAVKLDRHVPAIEVGVRRREVAALVCAPTFGAGQRRIGDQAYERVRIAGECGEAVAVPFEAGVAP